FVKKVCERLEDDGLLILMEPALLATSRALIELRDSIIGSGMNLVSPCLQSLAPCPALENPKATCHFQFDWKMPKVVADLARLAGLNRADVKMTYFIFSKSAGDSFGQEEDFGNADNSTRGQEGRGPDFGLANDSKAVSNASGLSDIFALVVSEPMLNKAGRIRFVLCNGKSRFTLSAKNGDPIAARQKFFDLRRYDKIQITNAQVRSQKGEPLSLGIGAETRLLCLENN
ncbi:MAG: small ribosomal subunit Rsm22 family protein, partial [Treponema sp.]|nr:small ribosomal subunit Rsm22 family protein [Treponema sp.]